MALPDWIGASTAYSKCYRILDENAATTTSSKRCPKKWPTPEADALIKALGEGDEARMKATILHYVDTGKLLDY
jgi:hypothetical protein